MLLNTETSLANLLSKLLLFTVFYCCFCESVQQKRFINCYWLIVSIQVRIPHVTCIRPVWSIPNRDLQVVSERKARIHGWYNHFNHFTSARTYWFLFILIEKPNFSQKRLRSENRHRVYGWTVLKFQYFNQQTIAYKALCLNQSFWTYLKSQIWISI